MITTLQIILAGVGVLFIVVIVGYNLWQERQYRREASRLFTSRREDMLLGESVGQDGGDDTPGFVPQDDTDLPAWARPVERDAMPAVRQEPAPRHPDVPATAVTPPLIQLEGSMDEVEDDLMVPSHAQTLSSAATAPQSEPVIEHSAPGQFRVESSLDDMVEYVARLRFARPTFTSYAGLLDGMRRAGKPVRAMGKRPDGIWEPLSANPASAYEAIEFGILLADRNGALSGGQLDQFCQQLYDFAAVEGGGVSCPDRESALQTAQELDMFCMDVDVLIGLNVIAPDGRALRGEDIDRFATDAGLFLERDGAYYLTGEDGHALFSLVNQAEQPFQEGGRGIITHGVTLLFDVPRVKDGLAVFDRMTELGLKLAQALGGRLVDDNGRPVSPDSLQKDRKRLSDYYARMQSRGIDAGGPRAVRIFA